jgi:MFS family permease
VLLLAPFYLSQVVGLPVMALGLVLACSPIGLMVSAPLAGRLAGLVPARTLLVAGAGAVAVSLLLVGQAAGLAVMVPAMVLQGVGLGLYQVAYTDIVTRTLPRHSRGVAGSLAMMTRTLGTVGGAAVLMLTFQAARGAAEQAGLNADDALVAGFRAAFLLAAAITAAAATLLLWRAPR